MSDLRRALDFIEAAERSSSLDDLQMRLSQTLQQFGVTQFTLMALTSRGGHGARSPVSLSRATAPEWAARYGERAYFNSDAIIHAAIRQSDPFTWDDLDVRKFSTSAKTVFDEGRDVMKVDGSLVIPTHDAKGFAGFISLFFPGRSPDPEMRRALKLIAIYGMEKAKELHGLKSDQTEAPTTCPLTPRQREALGFMAHGKTDWEIGQILGVASRTVENHFASAKRLLGLATRAQVLALAVHRGWIAL